MGISVLTDAIQGLEVDLANATTLRATEHTQNLQVIEDGKDGLTQINDAIEIITAFYKNAAKATVLVQASPVDEDTDGPGFSGPYRGQQESSKGIIGILHVIKTDFERTIRVTEANEKKGRGLCSI